MKIADIETLARFLVGADSNQFTAAQLLILDNKYYEEITGKIIAETAGAAQKRGDFNYTAFPSFKISMSDGVASYGLDDLATRPLTILGVEVLDESGEEHIVYPVSFEEIRAKGLALDNYFPTNGLPQEYMVQDNIIRLFPAPDNGVSVTLTNGLIIYYLRGADKFTSTEQSTGTKEPGFPAPWHSLIAYGAASDYAMAKGLNNANMLRREYERGLRELLSFVARRDQDVKKMITPKPIQYI